MAVIPLVVACLANVLLNIIGWAVSAVAESELLFDVVGAVAHIVSVWLAYLAAPVHDARLSLVAAAIGLWALRLGAFLFIRALGAGGDRRLAKYRRDPLRFLVLWLVQTVWVFFNTLPFVWLACLSTRDVTPPRLGALDAAGFLLYAAGLALEVIADEQKRAFRAVPSNAGRFISRGVWTLCRHPNYLGEMILWVGVTVMAGNGIIAAGGVTPLTIVVLASPAFVILLLLRVSGVPLLEAQGKAQWGEDAAYRRYIATTPVIFPCVRPKRTAA